MPYKAVIFDLDGTLLDTLEDLHASVNHALAQHGLPQRSLREIRSYLGNGVTELVRLSVPADCPEELASQVLDAFKERYALHSTDHTAPYPQVKELLRSISRRGLGCAVVSNKMDSAVQGLVSAHFPGLFDAVVGERAGVRRKPAPDSLLAVMDGLGLAARDVVYVGDSEVDLETARAAGVDCIAVSWGFRDRGFLVSHGATRIADTAAELAGLVLP